MYDGVATLIMEKTEGRDKYGNPVTEEVRTQVFVQPRGVYNSEFYNAAQLGEYEGKRYSVIRTDWSAQRDGISLICEERVENG